MNSPLASIKGTFRAVSTRDGEAQARDGQAFVEVRSLGSQDARGERIFEIRFLDGVWMLAAESDLGAPGQV